jgi:hypothetical protein
MDLIAQGILKQASESEFAESIQRAMSDGKVSLTREEFADMWLRHGTRTDADDLFDALTPGRSVRLSTLAGMLTAPAPLTPSISAMCVGFTAEQRRVFLLELRTLSPKQERSVSVSEFRACFEKARGFPPSSAFINNIADEDGTVDGVTFGRMCTIDPSSPSAVPFGVHHAARQRTRHSTFLGLTFYIPFVALLTAYAVTGRHLTAGRDVVALMDNAVRVSRSVVEGPACASNVTAADPAFHRPLEFGEIHDADSYFEWLANAMASLWHSARGDDPLQRAIGPLGANALVGVLRLRTVRYDDTIDDGMASFYDGTTDEAPLAEMRNASGPSAAPAHRLARKHIRKADIVGLEKALTLLPQDSRPLIIASLSNAFRYRSCDTLNGTVSFNGVVAFYPCGGYALDIPFNATASEALALVQSLRHADWLSGDVGAVVLEFFAFNVNELCFVHYNLMQETLPGGLWTAFHTFALADVFSFKFKNPTLIVLGAALTAAVLAYFVRFCYDVHRATADRKAATGAAGARGHLRAAAFVFADDPWLFVDVLNLGLLLTATSVRWAAIILGLRVREFYQVEFFPPHLDRIADLQVGVSYLDASVIVVTYFKVLRYSVLFGPMRVIASTISRSIVDLTGTAFAFAIFFFCYTTSAYAAYGMQLRQFSSVEEAASALLRAIVLDLDYPAMTTIHPTFTPIFFATFSIVLVLVALNMIIAVLTGAFEAAHDEDGGEECIRYVAAHDPRCVLAPLRHTVSRWCRGTALAHEVSYRARWIARLITNRPMDFGWHRNPRKLYGDLEGLLRSVYLGTPDDSVRALCALSRECKRWCRDVAYRPMPIAPGISLPIGEGTTDFESLLRTTFPQDANFLLLVLVWLPARVLKADPMELLEDMVAEQREWRRTVGMFAYTNVSEGDVHLIPHRKTHEQIVRRMRAMILSASGLDDAALDLAPSEVLDALTSATTSILPCHASEFRHTFNSCLGPPTEHWSLCKDEMRYHLHVERGQQVLRRLSCGMPPDARAAFHAATQSERAEDWADLMTRVNGSVPHVDKLRAAQEFQTVARDVFTQVCSEDEVAVRADSFPRYFFALQHRNAVNALNFWGYVAFVALFACLLLLDKGLGSGVRSATAASAIEDGTFTMPNDARLLKFTDVRSSAELFRWVSLVSLQVAPAREGELPSALDATGTRAIGAVKLRQIRVSPKTCGDLPDSHRPVSEYFESVLAEHSHGCAPSLLAGEHSRLQYGDLDNNTAFDALIADEQQLLREAFTYSKAEAFGGYGKLLTPEQLYPSDGFGALLGLDRTRAQLTRQVELLERFAWVDHFTRAVILDVISFNPNANVVIHSSFVVRIPAGGLWTTSVTRLPLRPWHTASKSWPLLAAHVVFIVALLFCMQGYFDSFAAAFLERGALQPSAGALTVALEEFFSTYWWTVDALRYAVFTVSWVLKVYLVAKSLADINVSVAGSYPTAVEPLAKITITTHLLDCTNFILCGAKLLFYVRAHPDLGVFTATIERSWRNLVSLLLATTVILCGFSIAGYSLFGEIGEAFFTFRSSLSSLLLVTTLGSFRGSDVLLEQNRLTYSLYFVVFVFAVKIVLLNLFIAVLTNGFEAVKDHVYDTSMLHAVMKNDPDVSFGGTSAWQRFCQAAPVREILYWCQRSLYACTGPSADDGTTGLTELESIRFRNPRLFWEFMLTNLVKLEAGTPHEQKDGAITLLRVFRDVEAMINNPEGDCVAVSLGYSTDELRQHQVQESRARDWQHKRCGGAATVHGFPRRTTEKLVLETFAKPGGIADEWEYLTVTLPQVGLGFGKARCLLEALGAHHVWRRERMTQHNSSAESTERMPNACLRADSFLY